MGKLYRREGSPYIWARWHDSRGKLCRESTKTSDKKVAALFLSAREAEAIKAGAGHGTDSRVTFEAALEEYLSERQPPIWSVSWLKSVTSWAGRLAESIGGPDTVVARVGKPQVEAARAAWLTGRNRVSPASVNRLTAVASGLWRWCVDRGYADHNPWARLRRFTEPKRELNVPTDEELDRWLGAIPNATLRLAAYIEADTALRPIELRRVRIEDLYRDVLRVVSSYQRGHTKTRQPRSVPLTTRALLAFYAQAAGRISGPLFPHLPDYRKAIAAAARETGMRFRWYDLRHFALTRMASSGGSVIGLRTVAGWQSDQMASRYIHPTLDAARGAVRGLENRSSRDTRFETPKKP